MKNFALSTAAVMAMSTFALAGGNIAPAVEPVSEIVAPVSDDSGFYVGVAYGMADYQNEYRDYYNFEDGTEWWDESGKEGADYDTLMFQAGYQINQYLSVEGRYWASVGSTDWNDIGSGTFDSGTSDGSYTWDTSTDLGDELTAWGIYLKPMYPVTEAMNVYALLGYGNVTLNNDSGDWLDEDGFQWGLGASYKITDNISVFADYVSLYDDDYSYYESDDTPQYWEGNGDERLYTINFGLTYRF